MRILVRNIVLCLVVIILAIWAIIPPEKKLRLGKDLRGGVGLVYTVNIKPGDPPDVIERVIETIKERVDPLGQSDITIVKQGADRIEITMPLPNDRVKGLKAAFEDELRKLSEAALDSSQFNRLMRLPASEREAEVVRLAGGSDARAQQLRQAAAAHDAARAARDTYEAARSELAAATAANADKAILDQLKAKVDGLVGPTADAETAYDTASKAAIRSGLSAPDVRRALNLPNERHRLKGASAEAQESPRERALKRIRQEHPELQAQFERVLAANAAYVAERAPLDDPTDLKRLLAGAGVLDFRITVKPGEYNDEQRLRDELKKNGPRNVRATEARWFKVNKIEGWYDTLDQYQSLIRDAAAFFRERGYVAEEYDGEYYMLCWDTTGSRLTRNEGDWSVAAAFQSSDDFGRPAISFEMNPRGAGLLQDLTQAHVNDQMAVLLDDQVYTAPNLRSAIGKNGQISGSFSEAELRYIIRVLSAGAMQAKLSPEPISEVQLAPELGADNLRKGFTTGLVAFAVVTVFMVVYYFTSGAIAVFALAVNFLLVLAVMSLMRSAFTLPGIAGIVLTFGQAIDANVLIYERMREEFLRGADMRTAVRLGFSRAFSSIVDGNVANLIICAVLLYFGTPEIRGFAITLGIGVLTTLYTALVVSRLIFTIAVDHFGWRHASQLPMAWPGLQRILTPQVDWMRIRWVTMGVLGAFLIASAGIWYARGERLLDTEFTGGTQIDLQLKTDPATGAPMLLEREQIQDRVQAIASGVPVDHPLHALSQAEVLPINPEPGGTLSSRFKIKMGKTDEGEALAALAHAFEDVVESRGALQFTASDQTDWRQAPVYKVVSPVLGENIDRPNLREDVRAFLGGVAVVIEKITPPQTRETLESRLGLARQDSRHSPALSRTHRLFVVEGTDQQVSTAVLVVHDPSLSVFENEARWNQEVAAVEWAIVHDGLAQTSQFASVQRFSAMIAQTFKAQAVVSVVLSLLLLTIYVWVRFGAGRWAIAATVPLFADVIGIVGLIAVAQMLYETPATHKFAASIGLLPFKLDLNQIAALLTITGYSLNDKIIIMDRIRENKGKREYASYDVINNSINQTLSRTFITAGTTLFSTVVLYLYGGEAVRGFSYAFTLGVLIGTYTSIVSSPLVWSRKGDPHYQPQEPAEPPRPAAAGAV